MGTFGAAGIHPHYTLIVRYRAFSSLLLLPPQSSSYGIVRVLERPEVLNIVSAHLLSR